MTFDTTQDMYHTNAHAFSRTRHTPWPITRDFLLSLPSGIRVLDLGCGNGRNMFVRDDLVMTGLERSSALCEIARDAGALVLHGNMTSIPFFANTFEVIMAVASYHHLTTDKEREQTIRECIRVLKPGGLMYIHVWAMEQPASSKRRFTQRDQMVPWKHEDGRVFLRYYRIYRKGDLQEEIQRFSLGSLECISIQYQEGNWVGVFRSKKST